MQQSLQTPVQRRLTRFNAYQRDRDSRYHLRNWRRRYVVCKAHTQKGIDQLAVRSEAVKSIREAMACIDDVQQYLKRWTLNRL